MRLVRFDDNRIGVLADGLVHDVSSVLPVSARGTNDGMTALIQEWATLEDRVRTLAPTVAGRPVSAVQLLAPIPHPRHLLAAPLNYHTHVAEMVVSRHAPTELRPEQSPASLGFFVKATGSICGPADAVELPPLEARSFHHEVELAAIIGKETRGIATEDALDHVFGYMCLLDITLRTEGTHQEERAMRKSFETFTPIGPCIVTADEIADPGDLELRLWVNDELRQSANTKDLIVGVEDLISAASKVVTLCPGDIYATGTPDGVGPILVGDDIRASIGGVGELQIPVVQRSW